MQVTNFATSHRRFISGKCTAGVLARGSEARRFLTHGWCAYLAGAPDMLQPNYARYRYLTALHRQPYPNTLRRLWNTHSRAEESL